MVSYNAMKKVEKRLCIRSVEQQSALLIEVMVIADENFVLSQFMFLTSIFSNFSSQKNF